MDFFDEILNKTNLDDSTPDGRAMMACAAVISEQLARLNQHMALMIGNLRAVHNAIDRLNEKPPLVGPGKLTDKP